MQTSKSWNRSVGQKRRQILRLKLYEEEMKKNSAEREKLDNFGPTSSNHAQFAKFQLDHMEHLNKVFNNESYTKLKWNKNVVTRKKLDNLVNIAVPKNGKTAVFFGNGPVTSSTKG